jgi:hypothetical protein
VHPARRRKNVHHFGNPLRHRRRHGCGVTLKTMSHDPQDIPRARARVTRVRKMASSAA